MNLIDDPSTRRTILQRQEVRRDRPSSLQTTWRVFTFVFSCVLRFSCLLIILAVVSVSLLALYEYLIQSPYIRLERVVVLGVDEDLKEELLEMAQLDLETSLLSVNVDELKAKLERHPWIRSIDVEKHYPNTLTIRAEKEDPWAIVVGEGLHYMNRWGRVFKEVEECEPMDLPVVTGIPARGEGRDKPLNTAVLVLSTLEAERGRWSLGNLSELHVRGDGSVYLYYSFMPVAIKARAADLGRRMEDLKKVVEHLNRTGRIRTAKGINLEYADGAVVSFRKG
ncbi:MAG: FtsQ-type POTRA domain-containing protein [Thermodesulfobacteriota bacterium]